MENKIPRLNRGIIVIEGGGVASSSGRLDDVETGGPESDQRSRCSLNPEHSVERRLWVISLDNSEPDREYVPGVRSQGIRGISRKGFSIPLIAPSSDEDAGHLSGHEGIFEAVISHKLSTSDIAEQRIVTGTGKRQVEGKSVRSWMLFANHFRNFLRIIAVWTIFYSDIRMTFSWKMGNCPVR